MGFQIRKRSSGASGCIIPSVLVLSAVPPEVAGGGGASLVSEPRPHYSVNREDHRTRCTRTTTPTPPFLSPGGRARHTHLLSLDLSRTKKQRTSHGHSGGAPHMWRDRQPFQVINPQQSGRAMGGLVQARFCRRRRVQSFSVIHNEITLREEASSP